MSTFADVYNDAMERIDQGDITIDMVGTLIKLNDLYMEEERRYRDDVANFNQVHRVLTTRIEELEKKLSPTWKRLSRDNADTWPKDSGEYVVVTRDGDIGIAECVVRSHSCAWFVSVGFADGVIVAWLNAAIPDYEEE